MTENINIADPGAEQPTITLEDGRIIPVLTDGTMPYAKSLLTKRLIIRASTVEQQLRDMIEEAIPLEVDAKITMDTNGKIDELQVEIDTLTVRATRLICPDLQDDDMPAFSREAHGVIHARFLHSAGQLMTRLNQAIGGTSE